MELLWTLAARSADVLIEANFRPHSDYERSRLTALGGCPVEVHCACPAELAAARYNTRARHPVHHMTHASVEALAEWDRPVGVGTLVTVETTLPVDVAAVAAQVRRHHAATREHAPPTRLAKTAILATRAGRGPRPARTASLAWRAAAGR